MSLLIRCDYCSAELTTPGGLMFSPPSEDGTVLKEHLCVKCYDDLRSFGIARRDISEVLEWDVVDGGILGAVIRCPHCPCSPGFGCDGDGQLHREYRLPGGSKIDLHAVGIARQEYQ